MIGFTDGGCRPNPGGPVTWAWVLEDEDGERVAYGSGVSPPDPSNTNFSGEYEALVRLLEHVHRHDVTLHEILSDSQVMVKQVTGEYRCRALNLRSMRDRVCELLAETGTSVRWIPRSENEAADVLAREAADDPVDAPAHDARLPEMHPCPGCGIPGRWPEERCFACRHPDLLSLSDTPTCPGCGNPRPPAWDYCGACRPGGRSP